MLNNIKQKLDGGTLELLKHGKNYVSASVMTKGLSLISIPVMTRLLSPSDYGLLAVFGSLVGILGIIFGFGFRGAVSRYYYERTDDFSSFFTTNVLFVMCAGIFLGIAVYLNRIFISDLMNIPVSLVLFAVFIAWISSSYTLVSAYLQASKQSLLLSRISVVNAVLSLILTIGITLLLKENLYLGSVYSSLIFSFIFFFFSMYMILKIGTWSFHIKHLKYSLVFGLPIIVHLLSGLILNSFDQIMINKMVGSYETGIYSFAYKVGMLFQMVIMGLNQAWVPIFYEKLRDDKYEEIEETAQKFSYLVAGAALLITMLGPLLITVLAPESYSAALSLVPVIIVGFIFQYFYFMYINYAFYAKKTSMIATITLSAGLINIGLNYWMIPIFGYAVAAWTTLITYALFFLMQYVNVSYNIKGIQKIPLKVVVSPGLLAIILILVSTTISTYIDHLFILFIAQSSLIIVYLIPMLKRIRT